MSENDEQEQGVSEGASATLLAEFLENHPPNQVMGLSDLARKRMYPGGHSWYLSTPDIQLHCALCGGVRTFAYVGSSKQLDPAKIADLFLNYQCRNCEKEPKTYSVKLQLQEDGGPEGYMIKIGEEPRFGPPVPSRAVALIGPDRDLFLKGREAETQGLGIGAYAYYRRVVENQWQRLLAEIIRVAKRVEAAPATIETLEAAASEAQFSKAVDLVKDAVPESLKIQGHNPLTLLYRALSKGVHELSDEECMDLATAIRAVLYELAERIDNLLKDHAELRSALTRLLKD